MEFNFDKDWLPALEARFGASASKGAEVKAEGRPSIMVYYFADFPTPGMLTAVTSGLSSASHPNWKAGKPELMITLTTTDYQWGKAAGFFALAHQGERAFSYGETYKLDFPIAGDSTMNACLVHKSSFLSPEQTTFTLPDRTVHLASLYPMYDEELEVYAAIGLNAFRRHPDFDNYNPRRQQVRAD